MTKVQSSLRCGFLLCALFCVVSSAFAQGSFSLPDGDKKDDISFELINNLVIIPVEINGTELSFLLDTGVDATIIFGITQEDSLRVNTAKPVKMKGLGAGDAVEALESLNNTVRVGDAVDNNHALYFVFDSSLNFSPRMGVPIHGILGYSFFKDFVVKTNYINKKLTIYDPKQYSERDCKKCTEFAIDFHNNKPYVEAYIETETVQDNMTFLVDSGSSDALWLLKEPYSIKSDSTQYFEDFLGLGISGSIYGKRSRVNKTTLGDFVMRNVKVAFPSEEAMDNITFYEERDGSLGGEILRRFTFVMNYPEKKMYLRSNSNYKDPFHYNMSGITVEYGEMTSLRDVQHIRTDLIETRKSARDNDARDMPIGNFVSYFLAPKLLVAEIREGSPAALAGVKRGDEIITVNGMAAYTYELYELSNLFSSEVGKRMSLLLKRNGIKFRAKFTLQKLI